MGRFLGGIEVEIEGLKFRLDRSGDERRIAPAYALTVHKSQGSQWQRVIVVLQSNHLLDRSMIYTAVTRATEQVIIVGDRRAFAAASIGKAAADRRQTGLGRYLDIMEGTK
jgi:exodeoxyribonuclease V alpha subunit